MSDIKLPENLVKSMKELTPCVVATVDNNKPYSTFISWLIAIDDKTLRMAVSSDAKTTKNIRNNPNVSIEVFDKDTAVSISGVANIIQDEIPTLPFPVSVIEIKVENVYDNLFPGATITGKIPFTHTGNIEKAEELDNLVLEALKA